MILSTILYYDKNEYNNGNGIGFYPIICWIKSNYCKITIDFQIVIVFNGKHNIYCWKQLNGPVIYGFIKKEGETLLEVLNHASNMNIQYIYNSARRQVFPISNNTTYHILKNYHNS